MADITLVWDNTTGTADWQFANGDLVTGSDLETSVLISLFTDRHATPDFVPTDGTNDLRGVWFDTFEPSPLGSNLWQLDRAKKTNQTSLLLQARDFCKDALQWMIDDGIIASVSVKTVWLTPTALGITVTVTEPNSVKTTFNYSYAWAAVAQLPQTVANAPVPDNNFQLVTGGYLLNSDMQQPFSLIG